uniref:Uncharacterized protein n=1 Tax=Arundo donax TaxID=35708 RepID=A0A0A8XNF6_ARUDO
MRIVMCTPPPSARQFLASCLAALGGEAKNSQHGLPVDVDTTEEREASPAAEVFALATFCGGGVVNCCGGSSSQLRRFLTRGVASMRKRGHGLFLLPPPDLRSEGSDREAQKTNAGVMRPAGGAVSLAAAEAGDPVCAHAGAGEGNAKAAPSVEPVRTGFGESRDAAAAALLVGVRDGS